MFFNNNDYLTSINLPLSPAVNFLLPTPIQTSSSDQIDKDKRMKEISSQHLITKEIAFQEKQSIESSPTVLQLRVLFDTRYNQPHPWPKAFPKASLDCEGLAHYLMKGKIGKFEQTETPKITKTTSKKEHKPYTCYKIWQPAAPWIREVNGFWTGVHFFMHLEEGECISKNGLGPIIFFDSFEEMLKKDAFPFGFITEDYETTDDMDKALIGESLIGTILF